MAIDMTQISADLHSQDNRITAVPIFVVEQRRRDYGYDSYWVEDTVWLNEDGEEQPDGPQDDYQRVQWNKTGYRDRWEFVQPFLTERAAQKYIDKNRHNLTDPRVFVRSGYRNDEWAAIREHFMHCTPHAQLAAARAEIERGQWMLRELARRHEKLIAATVGSGFSLESGIQNTLGELRSVYAAAHPADPETGEETP